MTYLKIVYARQREPKTSYPSQLINYLVKRFGLKKGNKLLELGVGNGDFLEEFARVGLRCFGLDKELSPLLSKNLLVKRVDLVKNKFPYPDQTFDVVYHKSVLEHFYRDEAEWIMKESKRVLKKGGKVIILVPDWPSQMITFFEDYTQVHPYDTLALSDLLSISGFSNVKSERFYQLPIVWKHPLLKVFSKLLSRFFSTPSARKLTDWTNVKFFRWSVELMVLGYGEKK